MVFYNLREKGISLFSFFIFVILFLPLISSAQDIKIGIDSNPQPIINDNSSTGLNIGIDTGKNILYHYGGNASGGSTTNNYYNITNTTNYNVNYTNIALTNQSATWTAGTNVSTSDNGWFFGLFNWIISSLTPSSVATFNGTTLWINDTYFYNQTQSAYFYNMTQSAYFYNQSITYYSDGKWITKNSTNGFNFNESQLSTTYYNATQSQAIAGTIDGGNLGNTQHQDGKYDGNTFNFSEASGSPGLDLRINFTGIDSFNQGVMRYKTSSLSGAFPIIQVWNYVTSAWEDYPYVSTSSAFATITQPVFDSSDHVDVNGIVQMRLYKASNGNTNNKYYIDWIAISKGFGTPSGEEVDPYSYHTDMNINATGYNISADYFIGNEILIGGIYGKQYLYNMSNTAYFYNQSLYADNFLRNGTYPWFSYLNVSGEIVTGLINISGAGGKVGIGTVSPAASLDISGVPTQLAMRNPAGNVALRMYSKAGSTDQLVFLDDATEKWAVRKDGSNNFGIYNIALGVDSFLILPSGNVGIGTASPSTNLHIKGTTDVVTIQATNAVGNKFLSFDFADGGASDYGNIQVQPYTLVIQAGNFSGGKIQLTPYNGGVYSSSLGLILDTAGNVGIGTTAPAYLLETAVSAIGANFSGTLYVNGTSGKVGIGTSSPSSVLTVDGKIGVTNNNGVYFLTTGNLDDGTSMKRTTANATLFVYSKNSLIFQANGDTDVRFWNSTGLSYVTYEADNRRVGIRTTSPAQPLHVNGSALIVNQIGINGQDVNANYGIVSSGISGAILGYNDDNAQYGILGYQAGALNYAVYGTDISNEGYAGYFYGQVYVSLNVSAQGFIDRTSVFNTDKNAFDYVKDASYYLDNGVINHSRFYGYTTFNNPQIDYSRPETKIEQNCTTTIIDVDGDTKETCKPVTITYYPHSKDVTEEGVDLGREISVHRQAIYEIKTENDKLTNCIATSKTFDEMKLCAGGSG